MVGGLLAASFFVYVFDLQGATAVTVIAAGAAPIGFNSVTLASVGKLDTEHATASLSVSVAIGLVTTSAIVLLGARWLGLSG
jgi:predicted permease